MRAVGIVATVALAAAAAIVALTVYARQTTSSGT